MTRLPKDTVLRLAEEAGMAAPQEVMVNDHWTAGTEDILKFAALIQAELATPHTRSELPMSESELESLVRKDKALNYRFALNGGAGPCSEAGKKIIRAVESHLLSRKS